MKVAHVRQEDADPDDVRERLSPRAQHRFHVLQDLLGLLRHVSLDEPPAGGILGDCPLRYTDSPARTAGEHGPTGGEISSEVTTSLAMRSS